MNTLPPVDYDKLSRNYDDVRRSDVELIQHFIGELDLYESVNVLDVGCGTGNHLDAFQKMSDSDFYGVEPSAGMRQKAMDKNPNLIIKEGSAYDIPFADDFFDFIYMTDVIHHVNDYERMFREFSRVSKIKGRICIVTQSHPQIERRPIAKFFPETVQVDQQRYPTIDEIVQSAGHFKLLKVDTIHEQTTTTLGANFLELVRKKGYSMLHLISDSAFERGLQHLESEFQHGEIEATNAGNTLVWLQKV